MVHFPCLEKCTADVIERLQCFFLKLVFILTRKTDSKIVISVQEIEINLQCTLAVENGNNF